MNMDGALLCTRACSAACEARRRRDRQPELDRGLALLRLLRARQGRHQRPDPAARPRARRHGHPGQRDRARARSTPRPPARRPATPSTRIVEGAGDQADRARPDDLVGACLFLLSDEAAWITGQIVNVDGGQVFRRDRARRLRRARQHRQADGAPARRLARRPRRARRRAGAAGRARRGRGDVAVSVGELASAATCVSRDGPRRRPGARRGGRAPRTAPARHCRRRSTRRSRPTTPAQLAEAAARHGVHVVDAPVSGGVDGCRRRARWRSWSAATTEAFARVRGAVRD